MKIWVLGPYVELTRNLQKDEISDLGKGKTWNTQLYFPALLLDNNAVFAGRAAAS